MKLESAGSSAGLAKRGPLQMSTKSHSPIAFLFMFRSLASFCGIGRQEKVKSRQEGREDRKRKGHTCLRYYIQSSFYPWEGRLV